MLVTIPVYWVWYYRFRSWKLKQHNVKKKFYFICPICGKIQLIEFSIKGKPYLKCNDCGVKLFVLGKEGIKSLNSLIGKKLYETETISVLNTINYFDKLKEKLIEVENEKSILLLDKEIEIQRSITNKHLNLLRRKLNNI